MHALATPTHLRLARKLQRLAAILVAVLLLAGNVLLAWRAWQGLPASFAGNCALLADYVLALGALFVPLSWLLKVHARAESVYELPPSQRQAALRASLRPGQTEQT